MGVVERIQALEFKKQHQTKHTKNETEIQTSLCYSASEFLSLGSFAPLTHTTERDPFQLCGLANTPSRDSAREPPVSQTKSTMYNKEKQGDCEGPSLSRDMFLVNEGRPGRCKPSTWTGAEGNPGMVCRYRGL